MQTRWKTAFLLLLVVFLSLATSCTNEDNAVVDEPLLRGVISSYNKYDGAMLDFTKEDMASAGFALGDVLAVTIDG
ncbi:MAG: hypothetical protein II817_11865, partial [Bacteroidales bacterium]|nr:hypothetical protein [Bacteroidales bacterium]